MLDFVYQNPCKIVFGRNAEQLLGESVKQHGSRVLLHYGGGSIKRNGVYTRVAGALQTAGIPFYELGGVQPNPRLSLVREGIRFCREKGIDFILAVGGGSVIDSAKAIAAGVRYEGDVWDYFTKGLPAEDALPVGTVLTIPAAGSEMSPDAVITNEEGAFKRGMSGSGIIPRFSILNPENCFSLSPYQTACGASDILAHLMERYFTQVDHVDLTDRLLEAAMKTVTAYAPLVLSEPENYDYRAEIMWAGTVAHNQYLNVGRMGDWASHGIEHELSGIYDIAHGAGLSIVFPAWMRYVYPAGPQKFVQFAVRVFGVDYAPGEEELIIEEGIRRLEAFYRSLGLPVRLRDAGIDDARLEEMAGKSMVGCDFLGNFKKLGREDVANILRLAL